MEINIRKLTDSDRAFVKSVMVEHWRGEFLYIEGEKVFPNTLEGFVSEGPDGQQQGLLTYRVLPAHCEIVSLNAFEKVSGIGTRLVETLIMECKSRRSSIIHLMTTNDNLNAIRFYQRRGFRIIKVNVGAIDEARKIKPSIPLIGNFGIAIHDEIVMEREV